MVGSFNLKQDCKALSGIRDQWYELATKLNSVQLNEEKDEVYWKWTSSRKFTVKYVYDHLTKDDCGPKF
jgi:hypothetical protein